MTRHISRRSFIAGAGATAAFPVRGRASSPANPDVIVIGAGAAGLAATRALRARGLGVVTIEASNRIGGRAHTDTSIFGVPYDVGAHWLHSAEENPFVEYAEENGFDVYEAPEEFDLYVGNKRATEEQAERYYAAYEAVVHSIARAGQAGRDVAPSVLVPDGLEWHALVHLVLGAYSMGKDFDAFSCVDWWSGNDGTDFYCREGFGTLVAHWARGIDVELGTRASRVVWDGNGISVETSKGTISAKACIVTVSTGVLAGGGLQFTPALPLATREAFNSISMGLYNHIMLQFADNVLGTSDDRYVHYLIDLQGDKPPRGAGLLTNVGGSALTLADVGGGFARELETEGAAASIDFARGELRRIYGSGIDRSFIKGHATAWGRNRLTAGSYASAEPGAFAYRKVLRQPVGERIWFAGEACSRHNWATVAGARESGLDVAAKVRAAL